jgi:hypothetical protein
MIAPLLQGVTFMSGNNLTLSPDLKRRTLDCDLWNPLSAADRPRPAGMVLLDEAWFGEEENRSKLLSALHAMVRHWHESGRPSGSRELASFEGWSRVVPAIVTTCGRLFLREWDCLLENTNERVGDKSGRDWKRLAELAMREYGVGTAGEARGCFEITVAELAGVARRHCIEQPSFHLYPEKDVESVMDTEGMKGGWSFKTPPSDDLLTDEQEDSARRKQASEWLTPKSRSAFGKAVNEALHEKYFKHVDGSDFLWRSRPGVSPARYSIERAT